MARAKKTEAEQPTEPAVQRALPEDLTRFCKECQHLHVKGTGPCIMYGCGCRAIEE